MNETPPTASAAGNPGPGPGAYPATTPPVRRLPGDPESRLDDSTGFAAAAGAR